MRFASTIAVLVLLLLFAGAAFAETIDDTEEIVSEYARGKRLMREGDYLDASRLFMQMAGRFPNSPNIDLFVFNRAKAEMYFGNQTEALATFDNFISSFRKSTYVGHAYFFRGNIFYQRAQLNRAVASYVEAFRNSTDPRLDDLVISALVEAIDGARTVALSPIDFVSLPDSRRCSLIEPVAEALVRKGQYQVAEILASSCGRELDVPVDARAGALGHDLELALVVPLSGEMQSFGNDLYQGAVIAAEQFREETGRAMKIVPYDTQGDPIDAARIVKELIHSGTDAVVGPLTSDEAAVSSAALSCGLLPMIAPAATEAGLTLLSDGVFQLSPNIELQGVLAAEYAHANFGADSAAIITSTSPDHLRMARAFADRFENLGGTVVAIQYYRPRDKDFGPHIRDLKAALLNVPVDSMVFINEDGDTLDVEAVPVFIDCLYLPGQASQLRLLLPQLNFHSIRTKYIGSDGWGDDAVYRLGDNVTRQAVFTSPFLEQERSAEYIQFAAQYDRKYGDQPGRLAALGYDAARLIGRAVQAGAASRGDLVAWLGKVADYQGASARVTFGDHRENIELPVYQLVDGLPVYLGLTRTNESSVP